MSMHSLCVFILLVVGHTYQGFSSHFIYDEQPIQKKIYSADSLAEMAIAYSMNLLWLGEMHGTQEIAAVSQSFLLQYPKPIRLVLEWNRNFQPSVDSFLATQDCRHLSFMDTVWQDGRYSEAMVQILRTAAQRKIPVSCMDYDLQRPNDSNQRDQEMAKFLATRLTADTLVFVISGNLHAVGYCGDPQGMESAFCKLKKLDKLGNSMMSVSVVAGKGEAWNCTASGCGPNKLPDQTVFAQNLNRKDSFVFLVGQPGTFSGFQWDGILYLKETHASKPFSSRKCEE
jgi:hypothetical protein